MRTLHLMVFLIVPFVAGCGKSEKATQQPASAKATFPWPAEDVAKISAQFGRAVETASGLLYQPISPGTSERGPRPGEMVSAHYRGTLLDGSEFDNSYKRGVPIRFPVGVGRVIKGWDEALLDMRPGEKRRLIIPYWLAYGEAGRPGAIPPKATLVFEVELVEIEPAATQ